MNVNIKPHKELTFNCDKCGKIRVKKWNPIKKTYSKINEISYWTDGKGYKNYENLCRDCLKKWHEEDNENFVKLISQQKRIIFYNYNNRGSLSEKGKEEVKFSKYK